MVGADNIAFDLNGRTVSGTPAIGDGAGIFVFRQTASPSSPSTNNRVINNVAIHNGPLSGIAEPGGPTYDLLDGNPGCDPNVRLRNRYHTAAPASTTTGGQQV